MGRCVELHGEGEAYLPALEALDRLARGAGTEPVVRCLSRFAPSWLAQMPWLSGPDEAQKARPLLAAVYGRFSEGFGGKTRSGSSPDTLAGEGVET